MRLLSKITLTLTVFLFTLPLSAPAGAATFQWENLTNRERITITLEPNDGLPGNVARIAKEALIIPFTQVPPAVIIPETPAGSKLFAKTEPFGNALAIFTQTDCFGFVVAQQTQTKIVLEIFPDAMGARWKKPATPAPTTEMPPAQALVPQATTPEATPATTSATQAEPLAAPQVVPTQTPATQTISPASPITTQPTQQTTNTGVLQASNQPALATPPPVQETPASQPSTTSQAPSQPALPATQTQTPIAPPQAGSLAAPQPPAIATTPLPSINIDQQTPTQPRPFLDARNDTAQRNAGLPVVMPALTNGNTQPIPQAPAVPNQAIPSVTPTITSPTTPISTPTNLGMATVVPAMPAATAQGISMGLPATPLVNGATAPVPQTTTQPAAQAATPTAIQTTQAASAITSPTTQSAQLGAQPAVQAASSQPVAQLTAPPTTPQQLSYLNKEDEELPVGSAVLAGPGLMYRARANYGGADKIELPALQAPKNNTDLTITSSSAAPVGDGVAGTAVTTPSIVPPVGHEPSPVEHAPMAEAPATTPEQPLAEAPTHQPASSGDQHTQPTAAHNATATAGDVPVIYVDEQGNPVDPPPDPAQLLPEVTGDIETANYAPALEKLEKLITQATMTNEQRETALHMRAEAYYALHQDDLPAHGFKIIEYAKQAINYNPKSERNAADLLRIGFVNLKLNNIPEAEAHFSLLRKQFPDDVNVPLTYYYWGDYYFNKDELQKAADQFEFVLSKYAGSQYSREAALGAARSFYKMGYFQKAFDIALYIEKRWSRFYLDYPPFLNMMGDVAFRLDNQDYALSHYWLYTNLEPHGEESDIILARIGDIYTAQKEQRLANSVYRECVARFPEKEGGLISRMRLAEASIHDTPGLDEMIDVFKKPSEESPKDVYVSIIHDHPKSNLAPLAELKLAMWYLWKHNYIESIDICSNFSSKYPTHELLPKAKEVAMTAFATMSAESVADGRHYRIQEVWNKYPIVQQQAEALPADGRLALAINFSKNGDVNKALQTLNPFFYGDKNSRSSEQALQLALGIYLDLEQWTSIQALATKVELWELSSKTKEQLDYALALSYENTGNTEQASAIWQKLYEAGSLSPQQMAYATYFLAQNAIRSNQLESAYLLGTDALRRLLDIPNAMSNLAISEKVKTMQLSLITVAEKAGRYPEALRFAQNYLQMLSPESPGKDSVMYQMARIYKQQGNTEAWQKQLTDIVTNYPESVYAKNAASDLRSVNLENKLTNSFSSPGSQ